MRKTRWLSFLTILLALFLVLAACGSSETSSEDTASQGAESSENGEASEEVVTINYFRGKDVTNATKELIKRFEELHPNIKVELTELPTDTGKQHDQYVTMFNAESTEVDVFDLDVIWPAEFAQAGYIMPLDRFIANDGIDLSKYNQGAVSAAAYNGQQWAIPKYIETGLLFYRTDIVSEDEVPKTWDELIQVASETVGQEGTQYGYLTQAKQYEGLVTGALEFITSYGGSFFDEEGNVTINSPEAIKGLEKMIEVVNSDFVPDNINTFTETETHTSFIEGQSVFVRNWPYQWGLANDPEQSKIIDKVGVAPLPAGDDGSAAALGGLMTGISAFTEHPEEAWEFLKFMTGPEGQKILAIHAGVAPTLTELFEDEEILEANPFFANEGFVKGVSAAVSRPVVPNYTEISEVIQIYVSKAISGELTAAEAIQEMEQELIEVAGN